MLHQVGGVFKILILVKKKNQASTRAAWFFRIMNSMLSRNSGQTFTILGAWSVHLHGWKLQRSYRFGRRFRTMSTARVDSVESQSAEIRRCAVPNETSIRVVITHVNGHHLSSSHHPSCLTSLITTEVFTNMAMPLEC